MGGFWFVSNVHFLGICIEIYNQTHIGYMTLMLNVYTQSIY